jgi:hypothetical protein
MAATFMKLDDTAPPDPNAPPPPRVIQGIWASPNNQHLLEFVDEKPLGAHDQDLDFWNLADGKALASFNELDVMGAINISAKTCASRSFESYRNQQITLGAPPPTGYEIPTDQEFLNALDPPLILGWIDDTHFELAWSLPVAALPDYALLPADIFQVEVTLPQTPGGAVTIACDSRSVPDTKTVLTTDPLISLRGNEVMWAAIYPEGTQYRWAPAGPAPQVQYIAGVFWP